MTYDQAINIIRNAGNVKTRTVDEACDFIISNPSNNPDHAANVNRAHVTRWGMYVRRDVDRQCGNY